MLRDGRVSGYIYCDLIMILYRTVSFRFEAEYRYIIERATGTTGYELRDDRELRDVLHI